MLNKKQNLRKKGFETKTNNQKTNLIDEKHFLILYFDVVLFMKQKQRI